MSPKPSDAPLASILAPASLVISTSVHGQGVQAARAWLANNGFTIVDGPLVGRRRADAYGRRPERLRRDTQRTDAIIDERMVEVERVQSLLGAHAARRMEAVAKWARQSAHRSTVLVVPDAALQTAQMALPWYDHYVGY